MSSCYDFPIRGNRVHSSTGNAFERINEVRAT